VGTEGVSVSTAWAVGFELIFRKKSDQRWGPIGADRDPISRLKLPAVSMRYGELRGVPLRASDSHNKGFPIDVDVHDHLWAAGYAGAIFSIGGIA
jgi:hypothetical protein